MKEYQLKYGCNPNQKPASVDIEEGDLPFTVLNGRAGYINLLNALNAWQLVRELKDPILSWPVIKCSRYRILPF